MDTLEQAILFAVDPPDASIKARADSYLEEVKRSNDAWIISLGRFSTSQYPEVRFWCLQTLCLLILEQYVHLRDDEKQTVRQKLLYWGDPACPPLDVPGYVRNKLAQAIVSILQVEYPNGWPSFFHDIIQFLAKGPDAVDMFCRILIALDQEIISLEVPRTMEGDRRSMEVKDAMRESGIAEVIGTCKSLVAGYHVTEPVLAAFVLEALCRYVNWADISLLATDEFVQLLAGLVERGGHKELALWAAAVLAELVAKRMDPLYKLRLIQEGGMAPLAANWAARLIRQPDPEPKLMQKCAVLLGGIATELLEAQKKVENGVVGLLACGLAVDEEAARDATDASSAAQSLLRQCFPSVLLMLRHGDDAVTLCLTPFLAAYLTQLKIVLKRSAMPNGRAPEPSGEQAEQLRAIMEAVADRASFPGADQDASQDASIHASAASIDEEEEEEAVLERRQELFTLFRNAAKIGPAIACAVVRNRLQQIMADPSAPFPSVEIGITLLYQLGEGASEDAIKSGGSLGALASVLMQHEVPASANRLVALALMETYVRYARVLQQEPQNITTVLAAFLGPRGIAHPDPVVAVRACYLFSRLCKPLRQNLRPFLPDVLGTLEGHLSRIAKDPLSDACSAAVKAGPSGRAPSGAAAVYATDDRLYAYEAAGILLGQDDLPQAEQESALARLISPLVIQIQQNLAGAGQQGDPRSEALLQQALEAVTRLSKGFSLQLCTRLRPQLGVLLAAPLDAARQIPQMLPQNKALRGRVISYLHRMVECLGEALIQYLRPALSALLPPSAEPSDVCDTLALLNQLLVRYKTALHDLLLEEIPEVMERVHVALGTSWDWSGAAAAPAPAVPQEGLVNGAPSSSEEARERADVQRAYYSFLHTLTTASLSSCLFQALGAQESNTVLQEIVRGAGCHVDPSIRKICVQTLRRLLADIGTEGTQLPGFEAFLLNSVVNTVCTTGLLSSSLDYRDGAVNALLGDVAALLCDVHGRAPLRVGPYLSQSLEALGVAPALATQLVTHVSRPDLKLVKSVLREMLQVCNGRGHRGRGGRPNGVTPDRGDSGDTGMVTG